MKFFVYLTIFYAAALGLAPVSALGQDDSPESIGAPRMRAIALQTQPPGRLSQPYVELLDTVADAIDHSTLDVAADRLTRFLDREREAGRKGVPGGYVDYVLHQVAVARSEHASEAGERGAYFSEQENAVLEHLSLLEKQYSDRAGSRLPDFVLREPVLGEFGEDDAVRQGLPQTVNVNEFPDRIAAWRETLDRVGEQRTAAIRDFTDAVLADPELVNRLAEAERQLKGVEHTVFSEVD